MESYKELINRIRVMFLKLIHNLEFQGDFGLFEDLKVGQEHVHRRNKFMVIHNLNYFSTLYFFFIHLIQ